MARQKKKEAEEIGDRLTRVCQYYESAAESSDTARGLAERDRDYYDNKQWTAEEESALKKRGQPATVRNRIKPKIDSMLGMERGGRTDPRANPRTPMDDQAANACTDAIRFVTDEQNFSAKRSEVFENILIEGSGGAIVEADGQQQIAIRYIPWDRMFFDPHSRAKNFTDSKYKGIVVWLDDDEASSIYGEKADDVLARSWNEYETNRTYDDKPSHQKWVDGKRKRVKVVELYYREAGKWTYCVYTKAGFLVEPQPSSYLDEDGEPECPIEYVSCHVDRDNNRYGVVRQLIGPQDEINKRASKALHRMSQQQTMAEAGAVEDIQKWKREQAKPDGFLVHNPGFKVEIQKNSDLTAFEMQMLAEAKGEIESIGANAALQGKGEAESGKALQIRRQSGVAETAAAFDALHQWSRAIYIQVWHRIKQFWTAEKLVRVTGDERNVQFVGLNIIDPATGQKVNDVSRMDVDIVLDDVPDVATAQQEEFVMLAEAYKANPQTPINPMGIPFDIVVENSSLRNKQKILDRMRGTQMGGPMGPQMGGQPMPMGAPPVGPDGQQMPPTGMPPPNMLAPPGAMPMEPPMPPPEQVIGAQMQDAAGMIQQAAQQAAMTMQQMGEQLAQQMLQGVQQAAQEAVQSIQLAGQQTAMGVQQAGVEAVQALQGATGQAMAQISANAAAQGVQAMMGALAPQSLGMRKTVITLPSGRTATATTGTVS